MPKARRSLLPSPGSYFWGDSPDEETFYASHGVRGSKAFFTSPRGAKLFTRSWLPMESEPKAIVCLVHGFNSDISWTFQSTAIFLAGSGFACFALDLPGHGLSDSLRGHVHDADEVAKDCLAFFDAARETLPRSLPRFLYGESMGGALCLLLHLRHARAADSWAGAVLVAPMCRISDKLRPPWPAPQALSIVGKVAPRLPLVPTASFDHRSAKVPEKRAVINRNPRSYAGKLRLGTCAELMRAADYISARLRDVTLPFIVLHGGADAVTDPSVSLWLYELAASEDKTIKIYEGMMHSLLFGETDENIAVVRGHILSWLCNRSRDMRKNRPEPTWE